MINRRKSNIAVPYERRRVLQENDSDDSSTDIMSTVAMVETIESIIDTSQSTPPSDTGSSDFGGFGGGDSGGGGTSGSW